MQGIHGGDIYRNAVCMDFSVNTNPLGMPPGVAEALHDSVERCLEYPDIEAAKLTRAVSAMLAVKEEYLLFGNGASELFVAIAHALRPQKVCIPTPSFYGYEHAAAAVESEVIFYDLNAEEDFLLTEKFLDILTEEIDLLFLANPNNPTGKRMEKSRLEVIFKRCREKGIVVVLDECFIEFCGNEKSMLSAIETYDNIILVRAFTKICAIPGVRLGYFICSNLTLREKVRRQLPEWNLSSFAQTAGIACAQQSKYVKETVVYVEEERKFLTNALKEMGVKVFDGDGNFILIYSEVPLYEELLQQGILIRDCSNFRGLSRGYYRIAVKQRADNRKLLKAIGECIERDRAVIAGRN